MKKFFLANLLLLTMGLVPKVNAQYNLLNQTTFGNNSSTSAYVRINGVDLYYETYGNGKPLLLLHGALESIS